MKRACPHGFSSESERLDGFVLSTSPLHLALNLEYHKALIMSGSQGHDREKVRVLVQGKRWKELSSCLMAVQFFLFSFGIELAVQ